MLNWHFPLPSLISEEAVFVSHPVFLVRIKMELAMQSGTISSLNGYPLFTQKGIFGPYYNGTNRA